MTHDTSHVRKLDRIRVPARCAKAGEALAKQLQKDKAILGVFDEGCMGMFNAIIPDHALHACGVFKERLSQSALYYETTQVADAEADAVFAWLVQKGMTFHFGKDHASELTREQMRLQCKMYVAAVRIADDFGCDAIGIQYQQGLKDLLPASDLVEGMLNNADRPPVRSRDGQRVLSAGQPADAFQRSGRVRRASTACSPSAFTRRSASRWKTRCTTCAGASTFGDDYVWVFLISGAAPPAHFIGGWKGAEGFRQPAMYFPNGGSTLRGVSKPGEIVWSRIYVEDEALHMDIGRGGVVTLAA